MRGALFLGVLVCGVSAVRGQGFGPLQDVPVPSIPGLDRYVGDRSALVAMGKSLFWDMQVGSDGSVACATCHFHAGADHRPQNQLSNAIGPFQPNRRLTLEDFPFRAFADATDNRSAVLHDSGQRTGSAGVVNRTFTALAGAAAEQAVDAGDSAFQLGALQIRQVTPRNAPSVINAVFEQRLFQDGRASDVFTGRTPFGDSDPRANAATVIDGRIVYEPVRLANAALASQATAPPLNTVEMSYHGRTWETIARKLLGARPLARQTVAPDDSILGPYVDPCCRGLAPAYTYLSLVRAAFQPAYWAPEVVEYNFPLFFALAIDAYESTLISDDTPFDRFLAGDRSALTTREISGLLVFGSAAACQFCHSGAELSNSSAAFASRHDAVDTVLTGKPGSLTDLFADTGFFHTGVRPPSEDPALDNVDDFSVPFSVAARTARSPLGIDGAFRIPGLRNVEFTGPYFHNGGQATLEQVIDFYNRGGDFPDSPGLPVQMVRQTLSASERADLVAFLKALSDDRVRFERAPFDHPELCVPVGYPDAPSPDPAFPSSAADRWAGIPAIGRGGNPVPLQTFEELLQGVGEDGTRAHTLTDACRIP